MLGTETVPLWLKEHSNDLRWHLPQVQECSPHRMEFEWFQQFANKVWPCLTGARCVGHLFLVSSPFVSIRLFGWNAFYQDADFFASLELHGPSDIVDRSTFEDSEIQASFHLLFSFKNLPVNIEIYGQGGKGNADVRWFECFFTIPIIHLFFWGQSFLSHYAWLCVGIGDRLAQHLV